MTKSGLIEALAAKLKMTKKDSNAVIEAIFGHNGGIIVSALKKGDSVTLSGFGAFEVRKRAGRKARNPKTGQTLLISPSAVPAFRPAKALKEKIRR